MIIPQTPYIDVNNKEHSNLVRRYSDAGVYIRQKETGAEYAEAVDTIPCKYTYEETDIPIASNSELVEDMFEEVIAKHRAEQENTENEV